MGRNGGSPGAILNALPFIQTVAPNTFFSAQIADSVWRIADGREQELIANCEWLLARTQKIPSSSSTYYRLYAIRHMLFVFRMRWDAGGVEGLFRPNWFLALSYSGYAHLDDAISQKSCRLVGPDLYGSRFERIHMNHPSTGLRNKSPACLLTL